MPRRVTTVLTAAVMATAAFVGLAPAASANPICNTTSGGNFDVTVCAEINNAIAGYIYVPYSVGSICVAGFCTTPTSGSVPVPVPNPNTVVVSGTICISNKYIYICRSFSSYLGPIHIG